jgi:peptide/nickel transport system substrate-binding protein
VTRASWALAAVGGSTLLLMSLGSVPAGGRDASPADGGTLRVELLEDPPLDYATTFDSTSWALAYATCANLMTYPDRGGEAGARPYPEGAASYPTVSRDGRTYTFRVRPGLRFQTGATLTAVNYAAALNRDLDPATKSPGTDYLSDVVGAAAVAAKKATEARGVLVKGNKLVIRLVKPNPDIVFRLAMPFFCPIPVDLPHDPHAVDAVPGSGPYYVAEHRPNETIELRRNPFYRGKRAHHPATILFTIGGDPHTHFRDVYEGRTDLTDAEPPESELGPLEQRYGLNRSRLFTVPYLATRFLSLNAERPLFRHNPGLRRAVNYALDRQALVQTLGSIHSAPGDRLLPAAAAGFGGARIYPLRPDLAKARSLARGHLRGAHAILYTRNEPDAVLRAEIVKRDLARIGIRVDVKLLASDVLVEKITRRGTPFDIADSTWFADYPDPSQFVTPLVDGRAIRSRDNGDTAFFDAPWVDRRLDSSSQLRGAARFRAYDRLDVRIMRTAAPYAPYASALGVLFVSQRVSCVVRHPYFLLDVGAFCLKGS